MDADESGESGRRTIRQATVIKDKNEMTFTKYDMPYIQDRALFAAVMWARKLIREKELPPGMAITRAARHYNVRRRDVGHHVGIAAARVKARKARRRAAARGPWPLANRP